MGINVRSDVADSNGCMPTFVTFMVVTVGFEGRTFTVGQYCGGFGFKQFDNFGACSQRCKSTFEPRC